MPPKSTTKLRRKNGRYISCIRSSRISSLNPQPKGEKQHPSPCLALSVFSQRMRYLGSYTLTAKVVVIQHEKYRTDCSDYLKTCIGSKFEALKSSLTKELSQLTLTEVINTCP